MQNSTTISCNKCNEPKTIDQIKHKNTRRSDGSVYAKALRCCKRCYRIYYSGKYPVGTKHDDVLIRQTRTKEQTTKTSTLIDFDRESRRKRVRKALERRGQKRRNIRGRQYIYSILKDAKCVDCGYDNWLALEFDHLPQHTKKYDVCSMTRKSVVAIQREIDKCEIVCSNCHTIRTFTRGNFWRVQIESEQS